MEEGQKQPMERVRTEEDDEDGISKLPDCLLGEILSRLPKTIYAVRTSALSKRWKHVWHSVSNLNFMNFEETQSSDFFSFVDKTLTQRPQFKLKKFMLGICYFARHDSQISNWIRYAVNCNVEDLRLAVWNTERVANFPLDELIFSMNSCFTDVTLYSSMFNPTGAISLKNLRCLSIMFVGLDEDLILNILSGSPVLETLMLNGCYGFRRLNIASKSVKNLMFCGHKAQDDIVEINAPNILSLTINCLLWLRKLLLLNVSSLVKVELDYTMKETYDDPTQEEEMLKEIILHLRHAKELKIGSSCFKVLSRLEAKGFKYPSNLKVTGDELKEQVDATTSGGVENVKSDDAS